MERDIQTRALLWSTLYFNSHAHVERDEQGLICKSVTCISTHTLTWSVTPEIRKTGLKTFYFNSHAHVERDCNTQYIVYLYLISTHTLTWSVTADEHAEMWIDLNFNSHAHVERDFTDHK